MLSIDDLDVLPVMRPTSAWSGTWRTRDGACL